MNARKVWEWICDSVKVSLSDEDVHADERERMVAMKLAEKMEEDAEEMLKTAQQIEDSRERIETEEEAWAMKRVAQKVKEGGEARLLLAIGIMGRARN